MIKQGSLALKPYQIRILSTFADGTTRVVYPGTLGLTVWPQGKHGPHRSLSRQGLGMNMSRALTRLQKAGYLVRVGYSDFHMRFEWKITTKGLDALKGHTEIFRACIGCGYCCVKVQCDQSLSRYNYHPLCPALTWDGKRHLCQLVLDHGPNSSPWHSLAIGEGCCSSLNSWRKEPLQDRKKTYLQECQKREG